MLLPEADRLRTLNQRFAASVTPAVARVCRVGALRDGGAIIYCGHGAAAARVRSQAASTARALSSAELPVDKVTVKVRADWARPAPAEKAGLGEGALAAWRQLSSGLPDGDLKQAIQQLLRHHRE